ncbi:MAG: hypothetical protein R3F65_19765 [bacterium]
MAGEHSQQDPTPGDVMMQRRYRPRSWRELPGEFTGKALATAGQIVGRVFIDEVNGTVTFKWVSETAAWPASFTIEDLGSRSWPEFEFTEGFEHGAFPSTAASHDVSTCGWKLVVGTETVGWFKRETGGTRWYGKPGAIAQGVFDAEEMSFAPNDATSSVTAHVVYDEAI